MKASKKRRAKLDRDIEKSLTKSSGPRWYLQILHTTWVFWGYGANRSVVHVDPAVVDLGPGLAFPFELPAPTSNLPAPREYERRDGFGWRWNHKNGAGHSWHFATSVEDAVQQAHRSLASMRQDTRKIFEKAITDVRVSP